MDPTLLAVTMGRLTLRGEPYCLNVAGKEYYIEEPRVVSVPPSVVQTSGEHDRELGELLRREVIRTASGEHFEVRGGIEHGRGGKYGSPEHVLLFRPEALAAIDFIDARPSDA